MYVWIGTPVGRLRFVARLWLGHVRALGMMAAALVFALPAASASGGGPMKTVEVGWLGGSYAEAVAVNGAGQVVGKARTPGGQEHAFSWTRGGGLVDLGTLNDLGSFAVAVTDSGQVIGYDEFFWGPFNRTAYRVFSWTPAGGMVDIGVLPGMVEAYIEKVSPDGRVVGYSCKDGLREECRPFSWTAAGGIVDLGSLNATYAYATHASDGGQVVGYTSAWQAFSWTAGGGMMGLGTLPGALYSFAEAVNESGQVVGHSGAASAFQRRAFSWTQASGMQDLGHLGAGWSIARFVSTDGTVFGTSGLANGQGRAFVWTADGGMLNLGALGGVDSSPLFVNKSGLVAGYATGGTSWQYAFAWTAGSGMAQISLGGNSGPRAVSEGGHVVGYSATDSVGGVQRGFIWTAQSGVATLPPLPGGHFSDAFGVNDTGQVVGVATIPNGQIDQFGNPLYDYRAVLWEPAVAPVAPMSIPLQTATEGIGFGFTVPHFSDADGDSLTYEFNGLPGWLSVCYAQQNPRYLCGKPPFTEATPGNPMQYSITVQATDPWGLSASTAFALTVQHANAPPVAPASIPAQVATEGVGFGFTGPQFSDADGEALTYQFNGLPSWLSVCYPQVNPRYLCGKPPFTEAMPGNPKQYAITVQATDPNAASASKGFSLTVQHANAPPVAPASIQAPGATEGVSYGYTLPPFSDVDGDTLTYQFSGLPGWLSVCYPQQNPRYLCGRPPFTEATPGNPKQYSITLQASDPHGGSASKSFSLSVQHANAPPVAPGTIPAQVATEGVGFGYTVPQFSDADGEALTYQFSGLPGWLSVCYPLQNPRYLCGKPPFTEATPGNPKQYGITVQATDPNGASASKAFSLTVEDANL